MTLLEPLAKSIAAAEALQNRGENFRPALMQVFTGPNRSGKTVQANVYATALYGAGLVEGDGLVIASFFNFTTREDMQRVIESAAGKVLAIDEFEKIPGGKGIEEKLVAAATNGDCVLIFTGKPEGMALLGEHFPKLFALLPKPISFETEYPRDPAARDALNSQQAEHKLEAEASRSKVMERRRLTEIWKSMGTVDVSLPVALKPIKTVRFAPKVKV